MFCFVFSIFAISALHFLKMTLSLNKRVQYLKVIILKAAIISIFILCVKEDGHIHELLENYQLTQAVPLSSTLFWLTATTLLFLFSLTAARDLRLLQQSNSATARGEAPLLS